MAERFASRRDTFAVVVCLALSVGARAAPDALQEGIASSVRGSVLAPFLALQQQAELFRTSRTRYVAVASERDSLALSAMLVAALREENDRLRDILSLSRRVGTAHVAADVLHQSGPLGGLVLLISAGRAQGVRPLAPVLAPLGLLGVVRSVEEHHSVVIAWTHPDFRASAMTPDGSVFGIVEPAARGDRATPLLRLSGVPYQQEVETGTMLLTAGFGGVYPRGIPLGRVLGVATEQAGWERTYYVQPAVQPAQASHVIVLLGAAVNLATVFGAGQ
ncbi:MAG: rod shape-determining protein MreC [Gemmatimonadales bacterium]